MVPRINYGTFTNSRGIDEKLTGLNKNVKSLVYCIVSLYIYKYFRVSIVGTLFTFYNNYFDGEIEYIKQKR